MKDLILNHDKCNSNKSKVDIIIVSHNNGDILNYCLDSIRKQSYKTYKIYLIDNDSVDGTEQFIGKNYPEVIFLATPNKGPAEKRNIGVSISNSTYILFMDSDAQVMKDWIEKAIKYMECHKNVGLLGGKIFCKNGGVIDSAGGIIARTFSALDNGYGKRDEGHYDSFRRAGYLKSATLMARREMIESIGGFDEEYFYDFEDTDLGLRANISGWDVIYNPFLVSYHLGHYTMKKMPRKQETFIHIRNKINTILKDYQFKTIAFYSPFIFASFLYNSVFSKQRYETAKAYLWNLLHTRNILEKRRIIQSKRKISDYRMFSLIKAPLLLEQSDKNNPYLEFVKRIRNKELNCITFFITNKCNSRCKHCFYWRSLNKKDDLALEEIEKILSRFYNVDAVLISGGEPFLRRDFQNVIGLVVKYVNPKIITIPTNGLAGDKIIGDMKEILADNPQVRFIVNVSLDGTEKYHDYIRGVSGSFRKAIIAIRRLNALKKRFANLESVSVNTVITRENSQDLPQIVETVKRLGVDDHFFDLLRGKHKKLLTLPETEELKKINTLRYGARKYYNKKNFRNPVKRIFEDLKDRHIIITQTKVLRGKKWPFECSAGKTDFVVESDGTLRICEFMPKIGNLSNYSANELLISKHAERIFGIIEKHGCDCMHICNITSSMNHSFRDIFLMRTIIDNFKKQRYFC